MLTSLAAGLPATSRVRLTSRPTEILAHYLGCVIVALLVTGLRAFSRYHSRTDPATLPCRLACQQTLATSIG
jgi:hypothetical protein